MRLIPFLHSTTAARRTQKMPAHFLAAPDPFPVKPFKNLTQEGIVLPFKNLTMGYALIGCAE
jgi:hypothetical protein